MAANFDVVVLSGPPFSGKSRYLCKHLQESHTRVCPQELFRDHPEFGLRDVALSIAKALQEQCHVVVEDNTYLLKTLRGYLKTVKAKVPQCQISVVRFMPKHGRLQCLWAREFALASGVKDTPSQDEETLAGWFSGDRMMKGFQDSSEEGLEILKEETDLVAEVAFKLETPGLMVQWEGVEELVDGDELSALAHICKNWSSKHHSGHVILVQDCRSYRGSATSDRIFPEHCLKEIIKKMPCPMYLLQVQTADAARFCVPPSPGILAFLQLRHRLRLNSKSTTYLYHSQSHRDMAESAGVRHIKLSKCLKQASLVSRGGPAPPRLPALLQSLVVEEPQESQCHSLPDIPLFRQLASFQGGLVAMETIGGKRESLFAPSAESLLRLNEAAKQMATCGREDISVPSLAVQTLSTSIASTASPASDRGEGNTSTLKLPAWMQAPGSRQRSTSLVKSESSSSGNSSSNRLRSTIYLMTERELLQTAEEILRQGGREDTLEKVQQKQQQQQQTGLELEKRTPAASSSKGGNRVTRQSTPSKTGPKTDHSSKPASTATQPVAAEECVATEASQSHTPGKSPQELVSRTGRKAQGVKRQLNKTEWGEGSERTAANSDEGESDTVVSPRKVPCKDEGRNDAKKDSTQVSHKRPQPDTSILDEIFL